MEFVVFNLLKELDFYFLFFLIYSHDIINRWVYPLVPDMGICCLQQNYMFLRNNVYRNRTVELASNAKLRENVVIHEGCRVGKKTEILNSVIGRNCVIGENCVLKNAFVFDGVRIGDKCMLQNCVIGRNSNILPGTALHDGTIIGDNCKLPDVGSLDKAFVVAQHQKDDYDEGARRITCTTKIEFLFIDNFPSFRFNIRYVRENR